MERQLRVVAILVPEGIERHESAYVGTWTMTKKYRRCVNTDRSFNAIGRIKILLGCLRPFFFSEGGHWRSDWEKYIFSLCNSLCCDIFHPCCKQSLSPLRSYIWNEVGHWMELYLSNWSQLLKTPCAKWYENYHRIIGWWPEFWRQRFVVSWAARPRMERPVAKG